MGSVTIISIIRLYSLDDISNSTDVSFDNMAHATLSALEANIGIVCACLPAMRPLFALIVPEYFSAATLYMNAPVLDIEQPKHLRTTSRSTGQNTAQPNTPRAVTPQLPRATISRTSSGIFSVVNSRPHTPGQSSGKHSRSGSNISSKTAGMRPQPARFQGRLHPLRMSPISSSIPSEPIPLSTIPPLVSKSHTRQPSNNNASILSATVTQSALDSTKPLPKTPFPVG